MHYHIFSKLTFQNGDEYNDIESLSLTTENRQKALSLVDSFIHTSRLIAEVQFDTEINFPDQTIYVSQLIEDAGDTISRWELELPNGVTEVRWVEACDGEMVDAPFGFLLGVVEDSPSFSMN